MPTMPEVGVELYDLFTGGGRCPETSNSTWTLLDALAVQTLSSAQERVAY